MSEQKYLLQITVGPIQDFIKAARRTRDLWFGSMMLSEISKAVALAVCEDEHARLIFPAADIEQLQPSNKDPNSALNVANVILAEVEGTDEILNGIAKRAKDAAMDRLMSYANPVFEKMKDWLDENRWSAQLEDILEFYCAWVPLGGDYPAARKQVGRLLAMRKNIRDFKPNPCRDRVPKCALDGLRESVFNKAVTDEMVYKLHKTVKLKKGEALDAIGLIKRMGTMSEKPEDQSFPSLSRVAVDPWVRGRGRDIVANDGRIQGPCRELVSAGVLSRVNDDVYSAFPYEGVALFPSRYVAMLRESTGDFHELIGLERSCNAIAKALNELNSYDRPQEPYVAFLCADGDRMGATLSAMETAGQHRKFSATLARFAGKARETIKDHQGVCIYTGGDDVMAILPLDTAIQCARALYDSFYKLMAALLEELKVNVQCPTLSVGLSIAHAMEDLELQLQYGREAETAAKGKDRNGLAVAVRARGNSVITVREQWKDGSRNNSLAEMSLDQRLDWWAEQFKDNKIPNKFPYELRGNAGFYNGWAHETPEEKTTLQKASQLDVNRIFGRKDITLTKEDKDRVRDYITAKVKDAKSIRALSDEMIVAQWIAFGKKQAERTVNDNAIQNNPA